MRLRIRASGFAPVAPESVFRMVRTSCLAGIEAAMVPMFSAVFKAAGEQPFATLAQLDIPELGRLLPDVLVCDVDGSARDSLELLRQIRFVLPNCLIAVYTGVMEPGWGLACHLAGVNCVLSKDSDERQLAKGLRNAVRSGCYTDPRFAA